MGGEPDDVPDHYRLGSPASLLPLGKPQFLLHGLADGSVPPSLSANYVELARSLGDPAEYLPLPGAGHMEMIRARGTVFEVLAAWLDEVFIGASGVMAIGCPARVRPAALSRERTTGGQGGQPGRTGAAGPGKPSSVGRPRPARPGPPLTEPGPPLIKSAP